jgi:hypothetical protein
MTRLAAVLAALALLSVGCDSGGESSSSVTETGPGIDTIAVDLPGPVVDTRSAILAAAAAGDYSQLGEVVEPEVFLSDYGFGKDPVGRWEQRGSEPLEIMDALLRMQPVVRETNEGTLYEWPSLNPDSTAGDMTPAERELFLTFMSEEEVEMAIHPEYGYTAPRLGILADGTWWFFVTDPGP